MSRKRQRQQRKRQGPLASSQVPWSVWHLLAAVSIFIAGGLIYSNTFSVPFVLDDLTSIVANPLVKDFRWNFSSRIIGHASFALNYALHGLDLEGYHLFNLLIHCSTGVLLYCLVVVTARTPFFAPNFGERQELFPLLALSAALLFVCHPIQTQAVTYLAQRVTSLATMFYMSALLCYVLGRLTQRNILRYLYFIGAALAAALAMMTKEISVTLPAVLLLYEILFFPGSNRGRWTFFTGAAAISLLVPLVLLSDGKPAGDLLAGIDRLTAETTTIPRSTYLFTQLRVVVTYMRLLLVPVGQNLDYDYPLYHSLFELPVIVSAVLLISTVAAASYWGLRLAVIGSEKDRLLRLAAFGLFWFFVTLSVESSIFPIRDVIFEHRLYLPSIGFLLAMATLVFWLKERLAESRPALAKLIVPLLAVTVFLLGGATWLRNRVWQDDLTLWEDVVSKSPGKARGHGMLAGLYGSLGRVAEAIREYRTALRLNPDDAAAHNNLGAIYAIRKEYEPALREYEQAQRLSPDNPKIPANIGHIFLAQGRLAEAERSLMQSLRLAPDYDRALNDLGIVLFRRGNFSAALEQLKAALRTNPDNNEARANMQKMEAFLDRETPAVR